MSVELSWAIIGVFVGIIAIVIAVIGMILHEMSIKRLQKEIIDPFSKGLKLMVEQKLSEAIGVFREEMKKAKGIYAVRFCYLIGLCYYVSNELDSALESYQLSLSLAKNFNDEKGEASARSAIGLIFEKRGEREQAMKYFEDALKILTKNGNQQEIQMINKNLARLKRE